MLKKYFLFSSIEIVLLTFVFLNPEKIVFLAMVYTLLTLLILAIFKKHFHGNTDRTELFYRSYKYLVFVLYYISLRKEILWPNWILLLIICLATAIDARFIISKSR